MSEHRRTSTSGPGDKGAASRVGAPSLAAPVLIASVIGGRAEDEADGPCRDYNYDPTILPAGIEPSDDPLLAARSSAYEKSFDLRTAEAADYPRTPPHPGDAP